MAITNLFDDLVPKPGDKGEGANARLPVGGKTSDTVNFREVNGLQKEEQISPGPGVASAGQGIRNFLYGRDAAGTFVPGYEGSGFLLDPSGQETNNPHSFFKWLANAQLQSGEGGVLGPSEGLLAGQDWAKGRSEQMNPALGNFDQWMGIGGGDFYGKGQSPMDQVMGRINQDWGNPDSATDSNVFKTMAGIQQLGNAQNEQYFDPTSSTNMLRGHEDSFDRMGPGQALGWQALANNQSLDAFNSFGGNDLLGEIDPAQLNKLLGGGGSGGGGGGGSVGGWANKVLSQGTPRLDDMFDEMDRRRDQSISTGTQNISQDAARLGIRGGFAQGKGRDLITEAITRTDGQQAEIRAQMENDLQTRYAGALNAEGSANASVAAANASAGASRHNAMVGARAGLLGNILGERGAAARNAQSAVYDRVNQGLLLGHDSLEGSRKRTSDLFGNRLAANDTRNMSEMDRMLSALTNSEQFRLQGMAGQDAAQTNAMNQFMQIFGTRDGMERQRMLDYITLSDEGRKISQDQLSGMFDLSMIPFNTELQMNTGAAPAPAYRPRTGQNNWLGTLAPALTQVAGQYIEGPGYGPVT